MKTREKLELKIGGFGRGEFSEKYVELEQTEKVSTKKKTAKEYMKMLDDSLEELFANKAEIEYNLNKAIMLYPEDSSFTEWKASYEKSFFIKSEVIVEDVQRIERNVVSMEEGTKEANVSKEKEKEDNKICEGEKKDETEREKKDDDKEMNKIVWPDGTQYWEGLADSEEMNNALKDANEKTQEAIEEQLQVEATVLIEDVIADINMEIKDKEIKKTEEEEKKEEKKDEDNKDEHNEGQKNDEEMEGEKNEDKTEDEMQVADEKKEEKREDHTEAGVEKSKEQKNEEGKTEEEKNKGEKEEEKKKEEKKNKEEEKKEEEKKDEEEEKKEEEKKNEKEKKKAEGKKDEEKNIEKSETQDSNPNYSLGMSQLHTPKKRKEKVVDDEEVASKKGPLVIKIKTNEVKNPEKKLKRIEKIGEQLKSPYLQRRVDVTKNTTTTENNVGSWLFALQGDKL